MLPVEELVAVGRRSTGGEPSAAGSGSGREPGAAPSPGWQLPRQRPAGESAGGLIMLVAVGSAGTGPGGTSSVFFGKGCEMIDQH